jgi:hypothetical protein
MLIANNISQQEVPINRSSKLFIDAERLHSLCSVRWLKTSEIHYILHNIEALLDTKVLELKTTPHASRPESNSTEVFKLLFRWIHLFIRAQ